MEYDNLGGLQYNFNSHIKTRLNLTYKYLNYN